jgi:hypothetical protein
MRALFGIDGDGASGTASMGCGIPRRLSPSGGGTLFAVFCRAFLTVTRSYTLFLAEVSDKIARFRYRNFQSRWKSAKFAAVGQSSGRTFPVAPFYGDSETG